MTRNQALTYQWKSLLPDQGAFLSACAGTYPQGSASFLNTFGCGEDAVSCNLCLRASVTMLTHATSVCVQEVQLLQAKVEMLRVNLTSARSEIEQAAGLTIEVEALRAQLKDAGIEPQLLPAVSIPPIAAVRASDASAEASEQARPTSTASGQASPSQISPFQSVALDAPRFSQILSAETAGVLSQGDEQSGLDSGLQNDLQTSESSVDHAGLVASLQKENAALKAQMQQLSQREAAEEADIVGLQSQNKDLIAELDKLRGQIGEVSSC